MRKTILSLLIALSLTLASLPAQASDWDTAGKILTGIAGLRLLTGGKVDILGTVTGVNKNNYHYQRQEKHKHQTAHCCICNHCSTNRVWVTHTTWKKKYIPQHTEYDPHRGKVIVEAHYIKYKDDSSGYWVYKCPYFKNNGLKSCHNH